MLPTSRRRRKAGIVQQIVAADQFCRLRPNRISHDRHTQSEITVGHFHGPIADAIAGEMLVHRAGHKTEDGFLHRNFDFLALAAALARVQSREDTKSDAHTGGFVADAECLGSQRAVVLPRAMGPAGDAVVARCGIAVIRVRSPLAVAARASIDQPWVERLDRVIVEIESLHQAFLVVLDEHVGAGDEPAR